MLPQTIPRAPAEGFVKAVRRSRRRAYAAARGHFCQLLGKLKEQLKEARLEAQKVILEAEQDSENLYKEALALATSEANASREKARREIDSQRDEALNQLKSEADNLGDLIIERLLAKK